MIIYLLASLIVLTMVISHNVRKNKKDRSREELGFWEKERLANQTRRKSLDNLDYIKLPLDALPMHLMEEDERIADCLSTLEHLSTQPIVNLTGLTNTDLKLEYGAANITSLTEYDQNYTLLASTLQQWAELLYAAGHVAETASVLEFAVSTRTDVSHSYTLLADIYVSQGKRDNIKALKETAETLRSLNKEVILRKLAEF